MAQDDTQKIYLELKNEQVFNFYDFSPIMIDSIRKYCIKNGFLTITQKNFFFKAILHQDILPIILHLEYALVHKIVYGRLYCNVKVKNLIFFF